MKNGGEFLLFSPLYISELLAYTINSLFTGGRKNPHIMKIGVDNRMLIMYYITVRFARLAQLVEHMLDVHGVTGSSPVPRTIGNP